MSTKLAPCPFCGGPAEMCKDHPTDFYYYVKCRFCRARIGVERTEEEAAKRWNWRTQYQW
jgi:Lar family restriction alleviation protein